MRRLQTEVCRVRRTEIPRDVKTLARGRASRAAATGKSATVRATSRRATSPHASVTRRCARQPRRVAGSPTPKPENPSVRSASLRRTASARNSQSAPSRSFGRSGRGAAPRVAPTIRTSGPRRIQMEPPEHGRSITLPTRCPNPARLHSTPVDSRGPAERAIRIISSEISGRWCARSRAA